MNQYTMKSIIIAVIAAGLFAGQVGAAEKKGSSSSKKAPAAKPASSEDKPSAKSEAEAKSLTASQKTKLMGIVNEGDEKALMSLPGIGETKAAAVKKARPFKEPLDLLKVDGIGEGTFSEIIAHAKAGFPEKAAEEKKPATKSGTSKSGSKSKKKGS